MAQIEWVNHHLIWGQADVLLSELQKAADSVVFFPIGQLAPL